MKTFNESELALLAILVDKELKKGEEFTPSSDAAGRIAFRRQEELTELFEKLVA
jgi:hypothetical protein